MYGSSTFRASAFSESFRSVRNGFIDGWDPVSFLVISIKCFNSFNYLFFPVFQVRLPDGSPEVAYTA